MCFRCARLGHSREDCRQPAVACSKCGGDHSESLHAKSDLTFGQRRALLNDAKGRQNPRAASAIPMSGGGESMPELTGQAQGLDIEDHEEDESGAFVTFAPALPVSSVVHDDHRVGDVIWWRQRPDLSLLADIFVDTSIDDHICSGCATTPEHDACSRSRATHVQMCDFYVYHVPDDTEEMPTPPMCLRLGQSRGTSIATWSFRAAQPLSQVTR